MKLVTCTMPTRGRNVWAALAVSAFLNQTYPLKHLLILDDSADPSFQEPPDGLPGVNYLRTDEHMNIPLKRNMLCSLAAGEFICHWDSDDWSHPARMADQVDRLEQSRLAVTGYSSMLFYDVRTSMCGRLARKDYVAGTSLMYRRDWWKRHVFESGKDVGEDNLFATTASRSEKLITVPGEGMMVARVHNHNTSPKNMAMFTTVEYDQVPKGFFA